MSYQLEIQVGGSTYTLGVFNPSLTDEFGKETYMNVDVLRDEFQPILDTENISNAEVFFSSFGVDVFGGRIVDYENQSERVVLDLGTFEEDAITAQPTDPTKIFAGVNDSNVVADAIGRVDKLSQGTIDTIDSNVDILYSNASPAKMIRELQRETGAFVRYNPDGSVDYLNTAGQDKTSTVIGPAESNISEEFTVDEKDREDYTHLRVLGASQGNSRIQAESVVSSYDPANDRAIWTKYSDKEITAESRAQKVADTIVSEYENAPVRIDISTVIFGQDVNVGDRFTVQSTRDSIDEVLTVVEKTQLFQGNADVYEVTLSNRLLTRINEGQKRRKDVEKFNEGYQGFVDRGQTTSGWDVAGDGSEQSLLIPDWPDDIESEESVKLVVEGRAWRSPVNDTGHSHNVTIPDHDHSVTIPDHTHDVTVPDHDHDVSIPNHDHSVTVPDHNHSVTVPDHNHSVTISSTTTSTSNNDFQRVVDQDKGFSNSAAVPTQWSESSTFTPNAPTAAVVATVWYYTPDNADNVQTAVRMRNKATGFTTASEDISPIQAFEPINITLFDPSNCEGQELAIEFRSIQRLGYVETAAVFEAWGKHNHTVDVQQSTTTADGGGTTETTTNGGGTTQTTTDGGATTETTTDGGGTTESTTNGGGTTETTTDGGGTTESTTDETSFEPKIVEVFEGQSYYPTDVEVAVNGSVVTTITGDPATDWQETVDLAGQLSPGSNTITANPTGDRGEIRMSLASELFRRRG